MKGMTNNSTNRYTNKNMTADFMPASYHRAYE